MRDIFSKAITGSFIAGAALLVAACGGSETANNTTDLNAMGGEMNTTLPGDDMNAMGGDMNSMGGDMNSMGGTDMNMTGGNMSSDMNMTGGNMTGGTDTTGTTNGM